jgi:hypothetical protein
MSYTGELQNIRQLPIVGSLLIYALAEAQESYESRISAKVIRV